MDIKLNKQDELNAVLSITITENDYAEKVEKSLADYRKKANIPGFRPGKVPAGLIKKQYGKSVKIDEVNHLLQHAVSDYLRDEKLDILGNPLPVAKDDIDWSSNADMVFDFELGLSPEIDVKISGRNSIDHYKVVADDATIDKYIDDIAKRYGKMSTPEKPEATDMFAGTFDQVDADDVLIEGGISNKNHFLGSVLKTKKNQGILCKMNEGDTMVLNFKKDFAKDYNPASLLGITDSKLDEMEEAIFRFTLSNVNRIEGAEINQELFDKVFGEGNVTSEEDFRARVKADIENMYKRDTDQYFLNNVSDYLLEKTNFDLPETFLKKWLQTQGEKPMSSEEAEVEFPKMVKGLRWQLIENNVIKKNDIKVSQEELMAFTKELVVNQMAQYGQTMEDKEIEGIAQNVLQNREEAERLNEQLYGEKLKTFYFDTFKVKEKEVSYDEFAKLVAKQ